MRPGIDEALRTLARLNRDEVRATHQQSELADLLRCFIVAGNQALAFEPSPAVGLDLGVSHALSLAIPEGSVNDGYRHAGQ